MQWSFERTTLVFAAMVWLALLGVTVGKNLGSGDAAAEEAAATGTTGLPSQSAETPADVVESATEGVAAGGPAGAARWGVEQVRRSSTGTWPTPSPAPTGLTYEAKSRKLLVSDGEVDEGPLWRGRNLFVVSRDGHPRAARTLVNSTNEGEGISWYGRGKALFVAADSRTAIFRFGSGPDRKIGTPDDTVEEVLDTEMWGSANPEGVTFRAQHGHVNMLIWSDAGMRREDANRIFKVERGRDHRFGTEDDVMSRFSTSAPPFGYTENEGVVYDPWRNSLFLVSSEQCPIFETTLGGAILRRIDTSAICAPGTATIGFSDLVFAPGTDGSPRRLYLTDHGDDHDPFQPGDNDGRIYQVKIEARP
jgi:hypothetical protein